MAGELTIDSGDTAWMLVSTALVLMMTAPGLILFYGGLVRRKNVLSTIMHSFFILGLVSVTWVLWGYSLAFGPDTGLGIIGGLDWLPANSSDHWLHFVLGAGMVAQLGDAVGPVGGVGPVDHRAELVEVAAEVEAAEEVAERLLALPRRQLLLDRHLGRVGPVTGVLELAVAGRSLRRGSAAGLAVVQFGDSGGKVRQMFQHVHHDSSVEEVVRIG